VDIVLNRRGGVSVRDQLVAQLELKILEGALAHGQRLPSVRALARRLRIHHNTVSAAYQDLETAGHVELRRGSGVFVRREGPTRVEDARGLDEMIRLALGLALRKGYSGPQIRVAVERWLAAAPPDRVLVVDPSAEMAELLLHELGAALSVPASSCSVDGLAREPGLVAGALVVVLPYHVEAVRQIVPGAAVEPVTLEFAGADRDALVAAPPGSIVLVVSHSPTLLPFAEVLVRSLRGDEVVVQTHLARNTRAWKRVAPVADLVLADALALPAVARVKPRKLREIRVVPDAALERLRDALTVVVPRDVAARGNGQTRSRER
jgi:GntR family transcriptional regulator